VLIHLSDRYKPDEWLALLQEVREVFPAASYPEHWKIVAGDSVP